MKRIDTSTKSVDKFGAGKHGFTNGNPATPIPATQLDEGWLDHVQEEIANVIEGVGDTLDAGDRTQLRQAIQAMIVGAQKAVIINSATFEASVADGEAVRWDSANSRFDEAIADGTANNRAVGIADVTNSRVYLYGECPLFSGLTPGSRYYLDASTAGAITAVSPNDTVMVGIAKSATTLWVDVDYQRGRTVLTGDLTLYVATTGSDSNDGLSAGSPLLTIQKAWDVLHKKYDLNGYTATIQLADGTYSAGLSAYGAITGMTGATSVNFKGNAGNSASVVISVAGATCFGAYHGAKFSVSNLTMTGGSGFYSSGGGAMISGGAGLVFGAMTVNHIGTNVGGNVLMTANYSITGGAYSHFSVASGVISAQGLTITLTGTPAFTAFASVYGVGILFAAANTFSGSATGSRYSVQVNGAVHVNGAGASYLPGSVAGSALTGGTYA